MIIHDYTHGHLQGQRVWWLCLFQGLRPGWLAAIVPWMIVLLSPVVKGEHEHWPTGTLQ
jgi:hypothetical protein